METGGVAFAWRHLKGSNAFGSWDEVQVAVDEQDLQLGKYIVVPVAALPTFIRFMIGIHDELERRDGGSDDS